MPLVDAPFEAVKRPEYTGENRCRACTVVNACLAAVGAALLAFGVLAGTNSPALATLTALVALALAGASIYLRGYLVPGTPELTKRYFPARLLALFGKDAARSQSSATQSGAVGGDLDPESLLVDLGALEECDDGADLCLRPAFEREWTAAMATFDADDADNQVLRDALELDGVEWEFVEHGDAVQLRVAGTVRGTWESRAAVLADAGAAKLLADRDLAWNRRPVGDRAALLSGLRLFLETCPDCGGSLSFGAETVESCCRRREIYALECPDCAARLFESEPVQ